MGRGRDCADCKVVALFPELLGKKANRRRRRQHLTDRQREVLQMLAEGSTLGQIAVELKITYRTVRFHKAKIMEELGTDKNAELVKYAVKHGLTAA